jgi:hypothetical protein
VCLQVEGKSAETLSIIPAEAVTIGAKAADVNPATAPAITPAVLTSSHTYKEGKAKNVCTSLQACTGQAANGRYICQC